MLLERYRNKSSQPPFSKGGQGGILTRPGQPGEGDDRAQAMALLDESLTISSELGMRPLMERVLSRQEILGA